MPTSDSENSSGNPEDAAVQWPPREYREWVQSQVANKMLLRLGALGVGSLVILAGSYFGLQNYVLDQSTNVIVRQVRTQVRKELEPVIKSEVLERIMNQPALIEETVDRITTEKSPHIRKIIDSEKFRTAASKQLTSMLTDTRLPQEYIMKDALAKALNPEESDSIRTMGLKLYALLNTNVLSTNKLPSMREVYVDLTRTSIQENILPPKLFSVIIEHYPFSDSDEEDDIYGCPSIDECRTWDMEIVEAMLSRLVAGQELPTTKYIFADFFGRIPPHVVNRVLVWVRNNAESRIAEDLLIAIIKSHKPRLLSKAVPGIASLFSSGTSTRLQLIALRGMAALDYYADVALSARSAALVSIWKSANVEEVRAAFSVEKIGTLFDTPPEQSTNGYSWFPRAAISRLRRADRPAHFEEFANGALVPVETESQFGDLLRASVVSLLRAGVYKGIVDEDYLRSQGSISDWEYVLQAELLHGLSDDQKIPVYASWVMRMLYDREMGYDVRLAADNVLNEKVPDFLNNELARIVTAISVRESSEKGFSVFAERYGSLWEAQQPSSLSIEVAGALIDRGIRSDAGFAWLGGVFGNVTITEAYRNHLLDAFGYPSEGSISNDPRERLTRAVRQITEHSYGEINDNAVATLIYKELLTRIGTLDGFWDVVAVVENTNGLATSSGVILSDLVADVATYSKLLKEIPWYGNPLGNDYGAVSLDGNPSPLAFKGEPKRDSGGYWFKLDLEEDLVVTVHNLPKSMEVAFLNTNRTESTGRRGFGGVGEQTSVPLTAGTYAIALRGTEKADADSNFEVSISGDRRGFPLSVATNEDPTVVETTKDFLFFGGRRSGEIWLSIELLEGSFLKIETAPSYRLKSLGRIVPEGEEFHTPERTFSELMRRWGDLKFLDKEVDEDLELTLDELLRGSLADGRRERRQRDIDTVVRLIDRHSGEEILSDDDGGVGEFSVMRYESERARDVLINISRFGTSSFKPEDRFRVIVSLVGAEDIVDAAWNRSDSPVIGVGKEVFFRTRDLDEWMRFSVPSWGIYGIHHDARSGSVTVEDSTTDKLVPIMRGDSRNGLGCISRRMLFLADDDGEYFVRIRDTDREVVSFCVEKQGTKLIDLVSEQGEGGEELAVNETAIVRFPGIGGEFMMSGTDGEVAGRLLIQREFGDISTLNISVERRDEGYSVQKTVEKWHGWTSVEWPVEPNVRYRVRIEGKESKDAFLVVSGIDMEIPYDGIRLDDYVRLGRHRSVEGDDNWNELMDKYVGCIARVEELSSRDKSGSFTVRVDMEYIESDKNWVWRTRDLKGVSKGADQGAECKQFAPVGGDGGGKGG